MKKDIKQLTENYRPISLSCGMILEQNKMFFIENELISHNRSEFKPGDSYISQLLCIAIFIITR